MESKSKPRSSAVVQASPILSSVEWMIYVGDVPQLQWEKWLRVRIRTDTPTRIDKYSFVPLLFRNEKSATAFEAIWPKSELDLDPPLATLVKRADEIRRWIDAVSLETDKERARAKAVFNVFIDIGNGRRKDRTDVYREYRVKLSIVKTQLMLNVMSVLISFLQEPEILRVGQINQAMAGARLLMFRAGSGEVPRPLRSLKLLSEELNLKLLPSIVEGQPRGLLLSPELIETREIKQSHASRAVVTKTKRLKAAVEASETKAKASIPSTPLAAPRMNFIGYYSSTFPEFDVPWLTQLLAGPLRPPSAVAANDATRVRQITETRQAAIQKSTVLTTVLPDGDKPVTLDELSGLFVNLSDDIDKTLKTVSQSKTIRIRHPQLTSLSLANTQANMTPQLVLKVLETFTSLTALDLRHALQRLDMAEVLRAMRVDVGLRDRLKQFAFGPYKVMTGAHADDLIEILSEFKALTTVIGKDCVFNQSDELQRMFRHMASYDSWKTLETIIFTGCWAVNEVGGEYPRNCTPKAWLRLLTRCRHLKTLKIEPMQVINLKNPNIFDVDAGEELTNHSVERLFLSEVHRSTSWYYFGRLLAANYPQLHTLSVDTASTELILSVCKGSFPFLRHFYCRQPIDRESFVALEETKNIPLLETLSLAMQSFTVEFAASFGTAGQLYLDRLGDFYAHKNLRNLAVQYASYSFPAYVFQNESGIDVGLWKQLAVETLSVYENLERLALSGEYVFLSPRLDEFSKLRVLDLLLRFPLVSVKELRDFVVERCPVLEEIRCGMDDPVADLYSEVRFDVYEAWWLFITQMKKKRPYLFISINFSGLLDLTRRDDLDWVTLDKAIRIAADPKPRSTGFIKIGDRQRDIINRFSMTYNTPADKLTLLADDAIEPPYDLVWKRGILGMIERQKYFDRVRDKQLADVLADAAETAQSSEKKSKTKLSERLVSGEYKAEQEKPPTDPLLRMFHTPPRHSAGSGSGAPPQDAAAAAAAAAQPPSASHPTSLEDVLQMQMDAAQEGHTTPEQELYDPAVLDVEPDQ